MRVLIAFVVCAATAFGQPANARAAAPFDLTGYWASMITQNWRLRMVAPAKGDYLGIPITPRAKLLADAWDPAKDEAEGNPCKVYGAPAIMMLPGRLHITWESDSSLRMDIDSGTQTRLFHFGEASGRAAKLTLQGESAAA